MAKLAAVMIAPALMAFLLSLRLEACPAFIYGREIPKTIGLKRNSLRIYAFAKGQWEALSYQIDPIDRNGRLKFFKNSAWHANRLESTDRFALDIQRFGQKGQGRPSGCGSPLYEFADAAHPERKSYLFQCVGPLKVDQEVRRIRLDEKAARLSTEHYIYEFHPDNQMLFRKISLLPGLALSQHAAAHDSTILIQARVKRFFDMSFDSENIESRLESYRIGRFGAVGRVSFFLKILFFKIRLSLTTDVSFFPDSAYIPMHVHSPYEAQENLRPGSGIFYSWSSPAVVRRTVQMPNIDTQAIKNNLLGKNQDLKKKYCRAGRCLFSLSQEYEQGTSIRMLLELNQRLVDIGFYPQHVANLVDPSLEWLGLASSTKSPRQGFYFETSNLTRGDHYWDFWMQLGTHSSELLECPHSLRTRALSAE